MTKCPHCKKTLVPMPNYSAVYNAVHTNNQKCVNGKCLEIPLYACMNHSCNNEDAYNEFGDVEHYC